MSFARGWHARAADYGRVANHIDAYETCYDLRRDALDHLLAAAVVSVSDAELDEMNALYRERSVRGGLGVDPSAMAHVGNRERPVRRPGAIHAGMQGVWLDRQGRPLDPTRSVPDPDRSVESMDELVALL